MNDKLPMEEIWHVRRIAQAPAAAPVAPTRPKWVTPSIQLTEDDLSLLRKVATKRAGGRGKVSISAVIQSLIEDKRAALHEEAST